MASSAKEQKVQVSKCNREFQELKFQRIPFLKGYLKEDCFQEGLHFASLLPTVESFYLGTENIGMGITQNPQTQQKANFRHCLLCGIKDMLPVV
ncbi:hypothetical protein TNCV_4109141 [Trichonephila clavipes]|nr:hypothetical protein TNCV_4109141 [Trichonephila clavipes]